MLYHISVYIYIIYIWPDISIYIYSIYMAGDTWRCILHSLLEHVRSMSLFLVVFLI